MCYPPGASSTYSVCPTSAASRWPFAAVHTRAVLSKLPVTMRCPSDRANDQRTQLAAIHQARGLLTGLAELLVTADLEGQLEALENFQSKGGTTDETIVPTFPAPARRR